MMDMALSSGATKPSPFRTITGGYRTKRREIAGGWPVVSTPTLGGCAIDEVEPLRRDGVRRITARINATVHPV